MKKAMAILLLIMIILSMTSCSKFNQNDTIQTNIVKGNRNIAKYIIDDYKLEAGNDDQIYFKILTNIVAADNGYYFYDLYNEDYLYFFDKSSKTTVPLCSRANCMHTDENCDAYIKNIRGYNGLWYYENYLYLIGNISDTLCLYKISKDGSKHEKCCDLEYLGSSYSYSMLLTIHRGYAYYSLNTGKNETELKRIELKENAKAETIYKCSGSKSKIEEIKGYGEGVFFVKADYKNSESTYTLFYYSITDNCIVETDFYDFQCNFAVAEDCILYSDSNHVMKYNTITDETTVFLDGELSVISYDGKYVYLDNTPHLLKEVYKNNDSSINSSINPWDLYDKSKRTIKIMDLSGNIIDVLNINNDGFNNFGDEDYIIMDMQEPKEPSADYVIQGESGVLEMENNTRSIWLAYDKSQIGTDSDDWIVLKECG